MDQELGTRIYVLALAMLVIAVASGCATDPETHFINGQLIAEMAREAK
jgi:hypothetical protein